jgi:hypothetical protein
MRSHPEQIALSGFPALAGLGRLRLEGRRFGLQPVQFLFLQLDGDFQVECGKQDGFPAGPGSPLKEALPRLAGQRLPVEFRRGYLKDRNRLLGFCAPGATKPKHMPERLGHKCDERHRCPADDQDVCNRDADKDQSKEEIHGFLLSLKREEKRAPRGVVTPRAGW